MVDTIIAALIIAAILASLTKAWKWAQEPITHLAKSAADWSDDDRRMLTQAGYDLSNVQWVDESDISSARERGCKPVLIPRWWILKREVRLPRKVDYALLMEKP